MFRILAILLLKLSGWKTRPLGEFPVREKKYIIIVAPHTSNWDFVVGVLYRSVLRLEKARFLGKKELFRPPFGFIFRWLGGTPVDRASSQNMVDQVVQIFNARDEFALALSPEGTRKKVERLRTGFYNIAKKANVPIIMVALDFENKQVIFSEPLKPTDSQEEDFEKILAFFRPIRGRIPEQGLAHL
jgi:1-acyl-sn-glycerol-3-phosphate acyltransferase